MKKTCMLFLICVLCGAEAYAAIEAPPVPSYSADVEISELKDFEVYPDLNELIKKDGQVYTGLLRILKQPGWKFKRHNNISYFYQMEDQRLDQIISEAANGLEKTKKALSYTDEEMGRLDITFFIFPDNLWKRLTVEQAQSFYLQSTSQVYLKDRASWCMSSTIAHELVHLSMSQLWPEKTIPLWLEEGTAYAAEHPACYQKYQAEGLKRFTDSLSTQAAPTLKTVLETTLIYPLRQSTDAQFFHAVKFIESLIGPNNTRPFINEYLALEGPEPEKIVDVINRLGRKEFTFAALEGAHKQFVFEYEPQDIPTASEVQLVFDQDNVDLGEFGLGEFTSYTFEGTNNTSQVIEIEGMAGNCGIVPTVEKKWIEPQEKVKIFFKLYSGSTPGVINQDILLKLRSYEGSAQQSLILKALVNAEEVQQKKE